MLYHPGMERIRPHSLPLPLLLDIVRQANMERAAHYRWYVLAVVDRWLRYEKILVPYGYILCNPAAETVRIISTLFYVWGTFLMVWREAEHRVESLSGFGTSLP